MTRHSTDPISLVFGVLFTAIGGMLAFTDVRWETLDTGWVVPGVLLMLGAAILWSTLQRLRPGDREDPTEPWDDLPSEPLP